MVRTIHAGRIVDEVGVQTSPVTGVFDTSQLGEAEIGTFADDLAFQRLGIDADGIVR